MLIIFMLIFFVNMDLINIFDVNGNFGFNNPRIKRIAELATA